MSHNGSCATKLIDFLEKQRVCNLTCPAGTLFNGKEGKTGTKLICKCNKKGVCKWKNTNNKKINGATYRGYFCQDSSDSTDDGDSGTDDSGTGDAGTDDNGTGGTGPATGTNDPTAPGQVMTTKSLSFKQKIKSPLDVAIQTVLRAF